MQNNLSTPKCPDEIKSAREQIEKKRKEIRFVTESFQVKDLVEKFRNEKIIVPAWQRNFVWEKKPELKSRLIESLLLGLPIPVMFFAEIENEEGKTTYEIVDGAQRTQTLECFYDNEIENKEEDFVEIRAGFELSDLVDLPLLNGFRYADLPEKFKSKLDDTFMRVVILETETSEESKRELFYRINTNLDKVNLAEKLQGTFPLSQALINKCIDETDFEKVCPVSDKTSVRLEESELVLRFFAYLHKYLEFEHRVDEFLTAYREKLEMELGEPSTRDAVTARYFDEFERMINFVDTYFENGFRKTKGAKSTPRVRYEAISVGVALALSAKEKLTPDREDIRAWLESDEFKIHTTSHSSNSKRRVRGRVEFVRDKLLAGDKNE